MTMLAASGQSPARAACRTASVSWPFRAYHRAARRCSGAIRSGCSRLSFSRSTSANNGWYRYRPGPAGWTNPFARATASKILRGPLVAGQFAGGLSADPLQDRCAQQDVPDLRRLDIQDLLDQVAGQGAVLGDQLR